MNISPGVSFGYKNYYNLNKRAAKGRSSTLNSGNYFGMIAQLDMLGMTYMNEKTGWGEDQIIYKDSYFDTSVYLTLVPKWGFNRRLSKSYLFHLDLGARFVYDFDKEVGIGIHLKTGFSYKF